MAWPYSQLMAGRELSSASMSRIRSAGKYMLLRMSEVSGYRGSWMTLS